jgi:hypothetical protein
MSSRFLIALLFLAAAKAQTPSQATPSTTIAKASAATPAHAKTVAATASEPVITIHGLCVQSDTGKSKAEANCNTVVNKQQFEAVIDGLNAIGPALLPAQRHAVAEGYANTLLNYEAAKKAGVERDPRFAEVMRLARMRAMSDMYTALQNEKARKVSAQEIQAYYTANPGKFEELTLRRITLPRYNSANLKDEDFAAKAAGLAKEIRERAAKGEDLDILQKEAYDKLGVKNPPSTKMAVVRRGIYAPDQEKELFALKPGECTQIIEQPSALIIFKLEGRETPLLEKSKDEIVRILTKQNLEKQEQSRNRSVKIDYNEQYLGPTPNSAWMPASSMNPSATSGKPEGAKPAPSK